jgi:hypothetical protein
MGVRSRRARPSFRDSSTFSMKLVRPRFLSFERRSLRVCRIALNDCCARPSGSGTCSAIPASRVCECGSRRSAGGDGPAPSPSDPEALELWLGQARDSVSTLQDLVSSGARCVVGSGEGTCDLGLSQAGRLRTAGTSRSKSESRDRKSANHGQEPDVHRYRKP